ncbi:hypothetical protein JCM5353_004181 [Sporobolomyces roseus]
MAKPRTRALVSDEPITQRIHVGGLAASVTPKELVQRFSSFGQVKGGLQGVSGLGVAPSGLPINYAFFNLETTQAQLNRCISMLNGSMWKSHKLRIQVAKPDWQQRREEDRKQQAILDDPSLASTSTSTPSVTEKKPKTKKRKLSSDPNVGYTAKRFEIVTPSNIENHKGWILDAKPYSSTPLFPLVVRPSHPIYLPPKAAATSWTRGKSSAATDKKKEESENVRERREVKRIKRIRIDPRRYGRKKLVYSEAGDNVGGNMISVGHWECPDRDEAQEEGKDEVTWVFKGRDGEIKHRETVKLNHSQQHTDQFKALLERLQLPECAKPAQEQQASNVMEEELAKIPLSPPMTSARARSLSPPPYIPSVPRQLLYNEEDAFQLLSTTLDEETRLAEVEKERKRLVRLAMGIVDDQPVEETPKVEEKKVDHSGRLLPKVEGFANDDESDDDIFSHQVLRLRGGAGGVPEDSDSDSDSSSDSEEEEDEKMQEEKEPPAKTTLVRESLKDMFKPQEEQAASFSLFSGLDLDLAEDDAERSPSPEPVSIPIPSALPPPLPKILPIYRNQRQLPQDQDRGPSYSFFGLLGLEGEELEGKRKAECEKRLKESGVDDWWKNQTQEGIDEAHSKLRENLRGFSRKRHRESVKRTKKKGSGAGNRRREGGLGGFTLDSTLAEE